MKKILINVKTFLKRLSILIVRIIVSLLVTIVSLLIVGIFLFIGAGIITMVTPFGSETEFKETFGVNIPTSKAELNATRSIVLKRLRYYASSNANYDAEIVAAIDRANNYPTTTTEDIKLKTALFDEIELMKKNQKELGYHLEWVQKLAYSGGFVKEAETLGCFDHDIGRLSSVEDWDF